MSLNDYIESLNEPQRAAVVAEPGPMLVIAGAGSGKTRVLTLRIAYLLANGVKPYNILALTFTNKAAREMKERIAAIVGPDVAQHLWMGTFHSIFARIIRFEAASLGFSSDYSIYDDADSKSLIKRIVKDMGLDPKVYTDKLVAGRISAAKNDLVMPDAYANSGKYAESDKVSHTPRVAEIYRRYVDECRANNSLDFDDLLLYANILFRDVPEALAKYQDKFQHILVDEYQDTNVSQYTILNRLAQARRNICVVGDDAQSIYSFRGARIENILNFQNDYPECRVFKLEQNYRSTRNIVSAANQIIAINKEQIPKNVFSMGDEGDKIDVWACQMDRVEGSKVVSEISRQVRNHNLSYNDVAILYRNNNQSRIFEEELRRAGIPYRIYGGQAFYKRKEIKTVLQYMRLAVNPADTEALYYVFNEPTRGIGDTSQAKIAAYADQNGISMWEAISTSHLERVGLSKATQGRVRAFADMMTDLSQKSETMDAYTFVVETLSQSTYLGYLNSKKDTDPDIKNKYDNIQEFLNGVKDFADGQVEAGEASDIRVFLQMVSLVSDQDNDDGGECVTLMTIHASKGLEFDSVFVVGVEDESFPSPQARLSAHALEEERRLLYVAVTRAKRYCAISYATTRYSHQSGKNDPRHPSRFVAELDPRFCNKPASKGAEPSSTSGGFGGFRFGGRGFSQQSDTYGRPAASTAPRPAHTIKPTPASSLPPGFRSLGVRPVDDEARKNLDSTPDGMYEVGCRVLHERMGEGTVKAIFMDDPNDIKLKILFDSPRVERTLLVKFARIKRI